MSDHKELRDLVRCGIHPKVGTVQILLADYDRLRQQCDELAEVVEAIANLNRMGIWPKDAVMQGLVENARTATTKYRENA